MEKQSTRKFLKLFVALVALFLLGSSALLLSSCKEEHTHDWGEGTVTVQPTCTAQGFKTFECSCGAVRTEPIQATGHKWDEGKVTTEPTCQPGVKTYTCQNCGETKTESIAATTGHEWVLNEELTVAPTCAKDGVKFYECANCGATQEIVDPATGNHEYNYEYIDASCEEWGIVIITCKNCTYYKQETDSSKPPLEHNYIVNTDDPNYVAPTCVSQGYGTFECTRCNDTYAGPIAALTTNGQHQWIVNTDADDKLVGFPVGGDNEFANVDAAKADGWTTVTVQNCTTAGAFQRVCDRCGEVEKKTVLATGHSPVGMTEWLKGDGKEYADKTNAEQIQAFLESKAGNGPAGVCYIDKDLTDAEGNALWAYECENENCPCEVVIDEFDTVKHYVEAAEHKFVLSTNPADTALNSDGEPQPASPATCEDDGWAVYVCSVCGDTKGEVLPETGHTLNTLQLDGRNEVIICEADATLNDEDDGEAAYFAAMKKAFNDNAKYAAWYLQNSDIWSDFMENTTDHPNGAYAFCTVCGELQAAKKHNYVVATLEDGKYGLNDYIVGEDGKPVVAEGVTEATMTCRNVLVCTNCLDVSKRGAHGETVAATCREGGYCKVCGEQRTAQLQHQYIDLGAVLTGKAADTDKYGDLTYNNKAVTYGQLRDAYEKVVATVTWMKPVAATCTTGGLNVYVCYKCLLDAANGTEFEWAPGTLEEDSTINNITDKYSYSAYTAASTTGHDYETVYFDLKATDPATDTPKDYAQTNCEFGFKVAYKCKNCGHWYTHTLVADDTTTKDKNEAEANVGEKIKLDGATVEVGFTDAKGFILDTSSIEDLTANTLKQEDFNKLTAEDHKDSHLVYIPANYASLNNYTAPNCVEVAVLPVVCLHCGAQLEYSVDTLKAEKAPVWESDGETPVYKFAVQADLEAKFGEDFENGTDAYLIDLTENTGTFESADLLAKQAKVDANNHKNKTFACGAHCNAYVLGADGETKMYCSAFSEDKDKTVAESTFTKGELTDTYHKTVVVTFKLSTRTEDSYLGNYELMIATVEATDINTTKKTVDWTKVDYSTTDKASKCAGADSNYTFPGYWNAEKAVAGKYFVLKDGNDVFALKSANFFTDDEDRNSVITATGGKIEVTVNQDDTFFVDFGEGNARPDGLPVVATNAESLAMAFNAAYAVDNTTTGTAGGKTLTVNVGADVDLSSTANTTGKDSFSDFFEALDSDGITDYVVDLGGHKITDASADRFIFDAAGTAANTFKANSVTLKNGTIDFKATADQLSDEETDDAQVKLEDAASVSLIKPTGDVDLTLDGMTVTTSVGTAIYAAASGNNVPTVTVKDSTITAGGAYAISTNASGATDDRTAVVVKVEDSTLTAGTPTTYNTNGNVKDRGIPGTALFINVPASVEVSGSEITSNYQAVVVRGGDVKINDSTITLTGAYEDYTITSETDYMKQVAAPAGSLEAVGVTGGASGYVAGLTVQDYRMLGYYAQGNGVARAAITIGNSNEIAYQYTSSLTLTNSVEIVNETKYADVVIASHYNDTTMGVANPQTTPLNVMVTVDSKIAISIDYVENWVAGTVKVNGSLVKK